MSRKAELEQLRLRKEQLIARSEANRASLIADWRRLQVPIRRVDQVSGFLRRHPLCTAAFGAAGTGLAFKIFQKTGLSGGRIGNLGRVVSLGLSAWELFKMRERM